MNGEFTPYLQAIGAYEDAIGRMIEKAMDAVLMARMGGNTEGALRALQSIYNDPRYGEALQVLKGIAIQLPDVNESIAIAQGILLHQPVMFVAMLDWAGETNIRQHARFNNPGSSSAGSGAASPSSTQLESAARLKKILEAQSGLPMYGADGKTVVGMGGKLSGAGQKGQTPGVVLVATRNTVTDVMIGGVSVKGREAAPKTPNETKQIIQNAIKDRVQARLNERLESMTMQERTNARGLLRLQQQGKLEEYFAALFASNGTVTASSDLQNKTGYSVFYLIDSGAVWKNGHAAMIMGSDSEGWYFFSFGYGSTGLGSSDNMAVDFFPTLRKAQIALQRYGYYLRWNVENASAIRSAFTEATKHLTSNYNVFTQNCDDIASSIIRAAGIPLQDKWRPNLTYMNQKNTADGTNSWRAFINLSD